MLSVWLTRAFCAALVEHLAAAKGGARAVRLDSATRRALGVGNVTGLGIPATTIASDAPATKRPCASAKPSSPAIPGAVIS